MTSTPNGSLAHRRKSSVDSEVSQYMHVQVDSPEYESAFGQDLDRGE